MDAGSFGLVCLLVFVSSLLWARFETHLNIREIYGYYRPIRSDIIENQARKRKFASKWAARPSVSQSSRQQQHHFAVIMLQNLLFEVSLECPHSSIGIAAAKQWQAVQRLSYFVEPDHQSHCREQVVFRCVQATRQFAHTNDRFDDQATSWINFEAKIGSQIGFLNSKNQYHISLTGKSLLPDSCSGFLWLHPAANQYLVFRPSPVPDRKGEEASAQLVRAQRLTVAKHSGREIRSFKELPTYHYSKQATVKQQQTSFSSCRPQMQMTNWFGLSFEMKLVYLTCW